MRDSIKKQLADKIKDFRLPRYHEIPDDGLYLEQTAQYINDALKPLGSIEMTTSMISNYVKKGIVAPPVKKLYHAEQIAYLFYIAIAKNVLSMDHILQLRKMQEKTYTAIVAYDYLCAEFENMLFYVYGLSDFVDGIGVTQSDEKVLFREVIIAATNSIHLTDCLNTLQKEKKGSSN